jgi:hypothetical protein
MDNNKPSLTHTPTPYFAVEYAGQIIIQTEPFYSDKDDLLRMDDYENAEENASFIIKAVNNHEVLIEALKEAKETISWMWVNMTIDDKNNQSDAFNIPANTLDRANKALENCGIDTSITGNEFIPEG